MDIRNLSTSNLFTDLGIIDYKECLSLQRKLVQLRKLSATGNVVLLLEHPSVYTIGRKADIGNFRHVNPVRTERGGDVTYHGPGQLVIYLIFDTRIKGKRDVGALIRNVSDSVIGALKNQGLEVYTGEEPGFWSGGKKFGSFGMAMDDYVSFHGISINTGEEVLDGFRKINPCGLDPDLMTYINIDKGNFMEDLVDLLSEHYGKFETTGRDELYKILNNQDIIPTSQIFS